MSREQELITLKQPKNPLPQPMQMVPAQAQTVVHQEYHTGFSWSLEDIFALHPNNQGIWEELASRHGYPQSANDFSIKVNETPVIPGFRQCYVYVTTTTGQLHACLLGIRFNAFLFDAFLNKPLRILLKPFTPLLNVFSRCLLFGSVTNYGALLYNGQNASAVMECILSEIERIRWKEKLTCVGFKDFHFPDNAEVLERSLKQSGFFSFQGYDYSYIDLDAFADFQAYLEHLIADPSTRWGRSNLRKLLEGNFIPDELEAFLRSQKIRGFPSCQSKNLMQEARKRATKQCRRKQALALLHHTQQSHKLPPQQEGQKRALFLDRSVEAFQEQKLLSDIRYEKIHSTHPNYQEILEKGYRLYEQQSDKSAITFPKIRKEWFQQFQQLEEKSFFLVAWRGEQPIGFYLILVEDQIYSPILGGYDQKFIKAHSLFFNMGLWLFIDAKKHGCTLIHLGPTAQKAKARMGAKVISTKNYVKTCFLQELPFFRLLDRALGKVCTSLLVPKQLPDK